MNSVNSIIIYDEKKIMNCKKYFPNATQLAIIDKSDNEYNNPLMAELNNIIPLNQITEFF